MECPEYQREGRRERGEEEGVGRTCEAIAEESWERSVERVEEKREAMILSIVPKQATLCKERWRKSRTYRHPLSIQFHTNGANV